MALTQSMLSPAGAMPTIVPCIFNTGECKNDPRFPPGRQPRPANTDVAWGSVLPLLGRYTAQLTHDSRLATRVAKGAVAYVSLLHSHANNASTSEFPGLLNYTHWAGHLGDWCPAVGKASVSTLLNSHHLILDTDAAVQLLKQAREQQLPGGGSAPSSSPSEAELVVWAATARESFVKAFLRNVTVPGTAPTPRLTCGIVPEKVPLELSCPAGQAISKVVFAGYGIPVGSCATGLRANESCYLDIRSHVAAKCVGESQCSVECEATVGKRVCAGVDVSDPCSGVPKHLSVAVNCSASESAADAAAATTLLPEAAIVGPAFHDPYPPDPSLGPQLQTEAASGLAAMDAAPTSLISDGLRVELGRMMVQLAINRNRSSPAHVAITGGIIDMAHLAPELLNHGHPDVAFDVLAADGPATYYNMAKCER